MSSELPLPQISHGSGSELESFSKFKNAVSWLALSLVVSCVLGVCFDYVWNTRPAVKALQAERIDVDGLNDIKRYLKIPIRRHIDE